MWARGVALLSKRMAPPPSPLENVMYMLTCDLWLIFLWCWTIPNLNSNSFFKWKCHISQIITWNMWSIFSIIITFHVKQVHIKIQHLRCWNDHNTTIVPFLFFYFFGLVGEGGRYETLKTFDAFSNHMISLCIHNSSLPMHKLSQSPCSQLTRSKLIRTLFMNYSTNWPLPLTRLRILNKIASYTFSYGAHIAKSTQPCVYKNIHYWSKVKIWIIWSRNLAVNYITIC